ncbi:unnamed protein product [Chironomus riparius]|uniref:Uncharacterized protein n=1 Tax=Chironomus riparius TaxID=315576 RepID=A0A9N9S583_9DIPT|nr:unnamed protein product [Chironomus riparius]
MKGNFAILFIAIAVFSGVNGGGNADCSSYISQYRNLSTAVQTAFKSVVISVGPSDIYNVFPLFIDSFLTSGSEELSSEDLAIITVISAGGETATQCLIPYIAAP